MGGGEGGRGDGMLHIMSPKDTLDYLATHRL